MNITAFLLYRRGYELTFWMRFRSCINWNLAHLEFVMEMERTAKLSEKTWNVKIPLDFCLMVFFLQK